jgi:hypothetical protein
MADARHPAAVAFKDTADDERRPRVTPEQVVAALRPRMLLSLDMSGATYIAFRGEKFSRRRLDDGAAGLIRYQYKLICDELARDGSTSQSAGDVVLSNVLIKNVIAHLQAEAEHECPRTPHFTRVAWHKGAVCIDLGQAGYEIARATAEEVIPSIVDPEINFVRPVGMQAMPTPRKMPGVMSELRKLLASFSYDDFKLAVLFMVYNMWPRGRWPVLMISGPEGAFKSSAARLIRRTVDPHALEVTELPPWPRDMATAGHNSRLVVWDNVSNLSSEQSDALCRRSDGTTSAYMTKFRDTDLTILRSDGPTVITTITSLVRRSDLARRCLFAVAEREPGRHAYRDAADVERCRQKIAPGILYELLNAIKVALAGLQKVRPVPEFSLPDFSRVAQAVAPAFDWTAEEVGGLLSAHIGRQRAVVAKNSPLVLTMMDWLATLKDNEGGLAFDATGKVCWTGTLTELLNRLNAASPTARYANSRDWPADISQLGSELRRLETSLLESGIEVKKAKRGGRSGWGRRIEIWWQPMQDDSIDGYDGVGLEEDWKSDTDTLH